MFQSDYMSYPWNLKFILKYSPKQAKRNLQFRLTKRKTVITVCDAPSSVLSPWGASSKCILREYSIYVLEWALMKTNKTRVYLLPSAIEISSLNWTMTSSRHCPLIAFLCLLVTRMRGDVGPFSSSTAWRISHTSGSWRTGGGTLGHFW